MLNNKLKFKVPYLIISLANLCCIVIQKNVKIENKNISVLIK